MFPEILAVLLSSPTKEMGANPGIDRNGRIVAAQETETATEIVNGNGNVSGTRTGTRTGTKIGTETGIETEIAAIAIRIGIARETPIERGIITGREIIEIHMHAPIETAMKEADLGQDRNG